jgi:hypothetical protein
MQTNLSADLRLDRVHHVDGRTPSRNRRGQATVLTGCAVAIGVAVGLGLGWEAALLAMGTAPVPLYLLWVSADVKRSDEV